MTDTPALTGTPVLQTDRLILRAPALPDFEAYAAFMAGPRSITVGGPMARRKAWRYFGHHVGHWALRGFGTFFMEPKTGGSALGMVMAWQPEVYPEREIGWCRFDDGSAGQGLMTEAARAVLAHVFGTWGWKTAVSYIEAANAASIRMAERLGATLDPQAVQPDAELPGLIYRHRPEAWQ